MLLSHVDVAWLFHAPQSLTCAHSLPALMLQVTQVKVPPFDVTTSLQVGCGSKKAKRLPAVRQGFFLKNNLPFKSKLVRYIALHINLE